MLRNFLLLGLLCCLFACKQVNNEVKPKDTSLLNSVTQASGFSIEQKDGYTILEVTTPWPDSKASFRYALVKESQPEDLTDFDAVLKVPLETIVVTSTTHIPSLEMLQQEASLAGFPFTDYVSSEKTRALIDSGMVKELGGTQEINAEVLIELQPQAVVGYSVTGADKNLELVKKAGIPVLYNGDWVETSPLGKAEWIKFFGALYDQQAKADSIFKRIEADYNKAKNLAANAAEIPTVLSGAMYKDVWYAPNGSSWAAAFIKDANANYLYADQKGTGSLSLSVESVLAKGQDADYWIGPGQFTSFEQMREANQAYTSFKAFKDKKVYSFTNLKGPTGGVIYYELAPNRPDLVLKDMIKILHPHLLPNYQLSFFSPLVE